jgi:type I restriction enzyme, S subunit
VKAGWEVKPLGDLCEFQRGLTYSKKDETDQPGTTVLRATNIDLATNLLDLSELRFIKDSVPVPDSKRIKPDRLLICTASGSKSHLGKVAYIDVGSDYAFGGFMGLLTPKADLLPRYLFHAMTAPAYKAFIGSLADGANINNLRFESLARFPVAVPPLSEQRRIVAILDEAFEGIAAAKANAEKNLRNAKEVFEARLAKAFAEPQEEWTASTIGEAIRFIDYRGKTPTKTESGLRLITAKNVKMGRLLDEPAEYVDSSTYASWMTRGIPKKGDILFTTEAPLANVAELDTDDRVVFAQRIIIMQPDPKALHSLFLKYMLMSAPVQQQIHQHGTGATVKGIKASLLKQIPVQFPKSLSEQRRIAEMLTNLEADSGVLQTASERKLAALDELKASLLHQVFTGQL